MTSQFLKEFLCFKDLYATKTYMRKNMRKQKTVRLTQTDLSTNHIQHSSKNCG